jgi:hypothetical protein
MTKQQIAILAALGLAVLCVLSLGGYIVVTEERAYQRSLWTPTATPTATYTPTSTWTPSPTPLFTPTRYVPTTPTATPKNPSSYLGVTLWDSADEVLEAWGPALRTEVVGSDDQGLVVKWVYTHATLIMKRRTVLGVTCYRVLEIHRR